MSSLTSFITELQARPQVPNPRSFFNFTTSELSETMFRSPDPYTSIEGGRGSAEWLDNFFSTTVSKPYYTRTVTKTRLRNFDSKFNDILRKNSIKNRGTGVSFDWLHSFMSDGARSNFTMPWDISSQNLCQEIIATQPESFSITADNLRITPPPF